MTISLKDTTGVSMAPQNQIKEFPFLGEVYEGNGLTDS